MTLGSIAKDFRTLSALQVLSLLVIGAAVGQIARWSTDWEPPFTFISSTPSPYALPGGTMVVRYKIERHRSCPFRTDRYIITSENVRVALSDSEDGGAPGPMGPVEYGVEVDVPARVPPGPATYLAVLSYRCNPLQYVHPRVISVSTRFVVAVP